MSEGEESLRLCRLDNKWNAQYEAQKVREVKSAKDPYKHRIATCEVTIKA